MNFIFFLYRAVLAGVRFDWKNKYYFTLISMTTDAFIIVMIFCMRAVDVHVLFDIHVSVNKQHVEFRSYFPAAVEKIERN